MMRQVRFAVVATFAPLMVAAAAWADPTVPGYTVTVYATVPQPAGMTFAPDGTLYVGNANNSATPPLPFVHKVPPGGGNGVPYGSTGIFDTDGIVFDPTGSFAGVANSVLVCGSNLGFTGGQIRRIQPDQSIQLIFDSNTLLNPNDMVFDSQNRLVLADPSRNSVFRGVNATLAPVITIAGRTSFYADVDASDNIYSIWDDGIIRAHSSAGAQIDGNFGTVEGNGPIRVAPGGAFGTNLYGLSYTLGNLYRFDALGNRTTIGTGFASTQVAITFGPDGALYVSEAPNNRILRIVPNCPGDADGDLDVDFDDLNLVLANFSTSVTPGISGDVAPGGAPDGFVDFDDLNLVLSNFGTTCAG